jgi:sulfur carrier protein ThiS
MSAQIGFTPNLRRHLDCPAARVEGASVAEALAGYFKENPRMRGYVLDDQGAVRTHVAIFLNRVPIGDRARLSDPLADGDEIFVVQALSGG